MLTDSVGEGLGRDTRLIRRDTCTIRTIRVRYARYAQIRDTRTIRDTHTIRDTGTIRDSDRTPQRQGNENCNITLKCKIGAWSRPMAAMRTAGLTSHISFNSVRQILSTSITRSQVQMQVCPGSMGEARCLVCCVPGIFCQTVLKN